MIAHTDWQIKCSGLRATVCHSGHIRRCLLECGTWSLWVWLVSVPILLTNTGRVKQICNRMSKVSIWCQIYWTVGEINQVLGLNNAKLMKIFPSCSSSFYYKKLKTTFEFSRYHPNMLIHNVELTILIHKIIVCIDASADELRYHHMKVHQDVGQLYLNMAFWAESSLVD